MRKIVIDNITLTLKKKTVFEKIISKEEALEFFDVFLKEYLDLDEYPFFLAKEDFVDVILSYYSIEKENTFIKTSNSFIKKRNTLVGYMVNVLCRLDYKVTDLINLTQNELFDVFTIEVYDKICTKKPDVARSIITDLVGYGLSLETATTFIENGIPASTGGTNEAHSPRTTTEEEDIKTLFKELE